MTDFKGRGGRRGEGKGGEGRGGEEKGGEEKERAISPPPTIWRKFTPMIGAEMWEYSPQTVKIEF